MNRNKNTKKADIISILSYIGLSLILVVVIEFAYLMFLNSPADPEPLSPPANHKKILEQLKSLNP